MSTEEAIATESTPLLRENGVTNTNGTINQEVSNGASAPTPDGKAQISANQLKYIFGAISIGVFLSAADQTIIVASYGKIGSDLNALNLTSWIATSYFLTLTSFQPLYGKLSDIFGRKPCLLFAYVIFGTGNLFCGLAQDINQLIAARVYQGIGGGGMTTVVSILMSDIIPLRDRGLWQGIINIIYATGSGLGAPLGGILADYIGWRWAFIAQVPLCLVAFILVTVLLKVPNPDTGDWRSKLRRIDFLGAIILVGAVLGFLIGLDRGSNVSWSIPISYIPLSISSVLFVAFILVEVYVAAEPFAPGHLIFDKTLFACYACNFFSFGGWLAAIFYLPLHYQAVDGVSATVAGMRLLPSILCGVSGSLFSGYLMRRTGRYYNITVIGYALLTVGMTVIFLFSGTIVNNAVLIIVGSTICAFGNGIGVTTTLIGLIANASPENQAVVTACSYLFRTLGSVIGLSLSATVEQQVLRDRLQTALRDSGEIDHIIRDVRQSLDFIKTLPPALQDVVRKSYGWSTNLTFGFQIFVVAFALFDIRDISFDTIARTMADEYHRYRPLLLAIAGVAAVGGLLYLRSNTRASSENTTRLRRRGAVLRRNRRPRYSDVVDSPSWQAIAHLERQERNNVPYGIFRIEISGTTRFECGLLPSFLGTREQLMAIDGIDEDTADRYREMMENYFLENFLSLDFPPGHRFPRGTTEREYLIRELNERGITHADIDAMLDAINEDPHFGQVLRHRRQYGVRVIVQGSDIRELDEPVPGMGDNESMFSWRNDNADGEPTREGQNLLNLLYHIAEDQARKDGYIHRGVTCNNCGMMPIQGIRYRCDNCVDFDLCEMCEAQQVHNKTHLFLKVRIPAPYMGNPRQARPVWYPGKPENLPKNLPPPLARRLVKETNFENTELDALWDQFRCLANATWTADPNKLGMAIDRKTFDRCFVPNTSSRPPPPSLIFDRMFAFYDSNGDNLIGFEEFLKGIASFNNKAIDEKMRRIFKGYDIDGDGYVERKDFLRLFRAFYALIKELTADMVHGWEEDFGSGDGTGTIARDIVLGTRPLSSAFGGNFGNAEPPRTGEGKRTNLDGDMEVVDGGDVLRPDSMDYGDIYTAVGEAAVRDRFGQARPLAAVRTGSPPTPPLNGHIDTELIENYEHAEEEEEEEDEEEEEEGEEEESESEESSGSSAIEEARRNAIHERWRRRQFYTDEEDGAAAPEGFEDESDVNESPDEALDPEQSSRPPSLRSRSSSKVRFEDDDFDVRSNGSTSVGERWGGFEVPEPERDVGKEILYQATKEGMNDLLDTLFKQKEDLLMEARRTRKERLQWAAEIESYLDPKKPIATSSPEPIGRSTGDKPLDDLLNAAGYSVITDDPPPDATTSEEVEKVEIVEAIDPTLPQHRPNEEETIPAAAALSLRLQLDRSTTFPAPHPDNSNAAEATAPKFSPILKPSPSTGSPVHASPTLPPQKHLSSTPSRRQLAYWARLNQVERESIERGGGAKLDYDEFRRIMNTEEGKKLSFISTYIEMASF
ncbi:EF hand domain protein [Talaromyces proteolyticus]|uniref:EF hand domain protein n=1 Tax=Talaromyces proteolyticus TaxID=1131652 RepID=A0AAD4Q2X6_9EURO|nr:EF hand domain protein [Talaromyces proteolyticus]KAH8700836.1 EF hand domain protein [Talaromyces proteolyticus]